MLEKTLESSLNWKEIQPVHPKWDQSWVFIGRTDIAEIPILWPPDVKSWLIWKNPDAGKDWRQQEKGTTENEMAGWHHRLNGHEFGWTPGVGDGQWGLACCNSWGLKESDTTEQVNWTEALFSTRSCPLRSCSQTNWVSFSKESQEVTLPPLIFAYPWNLIKFFTIYPWYLSPQSAFNKNFVILGHFSKNPPTFDSSS